MLLEFEFGNFRSFAEPATLSMVAAKRDHNLLESLVPFGDQSISVTAAIYGANASGKSTIIKAFEALRSIVGRSIRMNPDDSILEAVPFRLDAQSTLNPCSFKIGFVAHGRRHLYELSVNGRCVLFEALTVFNGNRATVVFRRRVNEEGVEWQTASGEALFGDLLKKLTRPNGLALSKAAELAWEPVTGAFAWFATQMRTLASPAESPSDVAPLAVSMIEDGRWNSVIRELMLAADFGIGDISVGRDQSVSSRIEALYTDHFNHVSAAKAGQTGAGDKEPAVFEPRARFTPSGPKRELARKVVAYHFSRDGSLVPMEWHYESNGTVRFFALIGPILHALEDGGLLVVDELDCSLHPALSRKIIELFHSPEHNRMGAQLIFTTHDASLMDLDLLRRDQIWIASKRSDGSSELYSLYDFPTDGKPRLGEALEKRYLEGRYGGVPRFSGSLHDLEGGAENGEPKSAAKSKTRL